MDNVTCTCNIGSTLVVGHLHKNDLMPVIICKNNKPLVTLYNVIFSNYITPALIELHWITVEKPIVFKLLLLTFKCLYGLAPRYRSDLIGKKAFSGAPFSA